ncbi:MAG TPA: hypothetical protein VL098_01915 [Flavipsychrobacter sp.]|nr:hypothetical protein [Flavipsychrobacter sp.]
MKRIKQAILIIFIQFVALTASGQPNGLSFRSLNQGFDRARGIVIGSLSIIDAKPKMYKYSCLLEQIHSSKIERSGTLLTLTGNGKKANADLRKGDTLIFYFVWKMDAGNYVSNPDIQYNDLGRISIVENAPSSLTFTVHPDSITYLGELEIDADNKTIQITDKPERDLGAIKNKYPSTDWGAYKNAASYPVLLEQP